jgi:signal transduction histidine kinase
MLAEIIERVAGYFSSDTIALLLLEDGALRVRAARGVLRSEAAAAASIPIGRAFEARVFASDQPSVFESLAAQEIVSPVLRASGVNTVLAAPLRAGERRIGLIYLGLVDPPPFSPEDLELLQRVADRTAVAVTQAQTADELRRLSDHRTRLQALTSRVAQATVEKDVAAALADSLYHPSRASALVVCFADSGSLRIAAQQGLEDEHIRLLCDLAASDCRHDLQAAREHPGVFYETPDALATRHPELVRRVQPQRLCAVALIPLVAGDEALGMMGLAFSQAHLFDQEERDFYLSLAQGCAQAIGRMRLLESERRRRARAEAESAHLARLETAARESEHRLAFLARASAELNRSLDYYKTLTEVANLAVPTIADWCAVDVLRNGQLVRLAVAHADPAKVRLVRDIQRRYPAREDDRAGVFRILRTGRPEFLAEISDERLDSFARGEEHRKLLHQLSLRSYIGVPIRCGGETIGVITLIMAESGRTYGELHLSLALSLADRVAVAVENARLFRDAELARAQSRRERDALHSLFMQAPMPVAVFHGPQHVYDLANPAYREAFQVQSVQGRTFADALPALARGGKLAMLDRVFQTGERVTGTEFPATVIRGDGTPELRYFDFVLDPVRDDQGRITGIVNVGVDVTGQVRARERTDFARADAEAASRAKDDFLAMLGHELRNPLAPIVTALDLIRLHGHGDGMKAYELIDRQVHHLIRLVDDLLDISRVSHGKIELKKAPIAVGEIVARSVEMVSPLLEKRAHHLTVEVPGELRVEGDSTRLGQVMTNILTNAAKYTEPGGRISVRAYRDGEAVVMAVKDNGPGIEPELLPRVFDSFVQGQRSLDRGQGGLGLGLALVRSLVELHGGSVWVESNGRGAGSEVFVRLPVARDEVRAESPRARPVPHADPKHILVVDDNVDAADSLADILRSEGHAVEVAYDGPEALRAASCSPPNLAILDIGLPVMDGYELAQQLRERDGGHGLVLMALTGYGQDTDRRRSAEAGFARHLVKPIDLDHLLRAIADLSG